MLDWMVGMGWSFDVDIVFGVLFSSVLKMMVLVDRERIL